MQIGIISKKYVIANVCFGVTFEGVSFSTENEENFIPFECMDGRESSFEIIFSNKCCIKIDDKYLIRHFSDKEGYDFFCYKTESLLIYIQRLNSVCYCSLCIDSANNVAKIFIDADIVSNLSYALTKTILDTFSLFEVKNNIFRLHASAIKFKENAYLFVGRSGRGKSTHSKMWLKAFGDAELINDDGPFIRIQNNGQIIVYGSPWSGKTPCFKNISGLLDGIVQIHQSKQNRIEEVKTLRSFAILRPCLIGDKRWNRELSSQLENIVIKVVDKVKVYDLYCSPTIDAATICMKKITKK